MAFYLIGLGLNPPADISQKGLKLIKKSNKVYLEIYTNCLQKELDEFERVLGKKPTFISREELEETDKLVEEAKTGNVSLLIIGDPLFATTHMELLLRIKQQKLNYEVLHNASVMDGILNTGLQAYKFGRTVSLPHSKPLRSPYNFIKQNIKIGLHTLLLLDVEREGRDFMSISEAFDILLEMESKFKEGVLPERLLACSKLGSPEEKIRFGSPNELKKIEFSPPNCLIIPGELHFLEEEALELHK